MTIALIVPLAPAQTLMARVTIQGTAMPEAWLCIDHFKEPFISVYDAEARDDVDASAGWRDCTGNDCLECLECPPAPDSGE